MPGFASSLLALITATATDLPPDVRRAMRRALGVEAPASLSGQSLAIIDANIALASRDSAPICQDTGMPTFFLRTPVGCDQIALAQEIRAAIAEATRRGKLRPNSVDPLTGANSGDNLGPGTPVLHFEQWENGEEIEIKLLLKGGGCENKNIQYSLPAELERVGRASRDLEGARKCILHAVWQAQGQGCAPGALGVAIGGDRASGYEAAKTQLLRPLEDTNPDPRLAELERDIVERANTLGIGAMGFGGAVSLIGCKITALNRLPASFFVSVAYECWAFRRLGVVLDARSGEIKRWLYREQAEAEAPAPAPAADGGRRIPLRAPLSEADARRLKAGDLVAISGRIVTGRDAVHARLMHEGPPVSLRGAVLYHCGPVALEAPGCGWRITAAGPTTSSREEPYQAEVLRRYGVRAVIGKGGMGARTLAALAACGAVYLNAVGGAAQFYARAIRAVHGVHWLELGRPEAMWELEVEDFPAVVTMDAHGRSLHREIEATSGESLAALAAAARGGSADAPGGKAGTAACESPDAAARETPACKM
ncbi:MAG TPA: FumA C-terminus/TtdB family hydratase beta subunit [Terriglobales bacterium]|nr:FumA C-terminus/TtdB family hydratase beta subunit [Terriglobales bacterium]